MKKVIYSFIVFTLLIFIILNPKISVEAARYGLMLWINTIIPTLFPFILLSNMIISLDAVSYITFFIYPVAKKLLNVSSYGCYAIITGFLCGYPMGAKVTSDLYANRKITKAEGNYLLFFTNNASPVFIINYVLVAFSDYNKKYYLLLILYLTPIIVAIITKPFYDKMRKNGVYNMSINEIEETNSNLDFSIIDNAIINAFETMVKLGGYIIIFSLVTQLILTIPLFTKTIRYIIIAFIEITTGIACISSSSLSQSMKLCIIISSVSFGGISCLFQSFSIVKKSNLSIMYCLIGNILSGVIALVLTLIFII